MIYIRTVHFAVIGLSLVLNKEGLVVWDKDSVAGISDQATLIGWIFFVQPAHFFSNWSDRMKCSLIIINLYI